MQNARLWHGAIVSHGQEGFQDTIEAEPIFVGCINRLGEEETFPELGVLSQISDDFLTVKLVEPPLPYQSGNEILGRVGLGNGGYLINVKHQD